MPEWTCLGNPASSFGEAAYGQPVTVGWWRPHREPPFSKSVGRTPVVSLQRLKIRNTEMHKAVDVIRVGDAERYRRLIRGRPAPNVQNHPDIRKLKVPRRVAVTQAQNASAEDLFVVASRPLNVGDGKKMRDADPLSRGHLIALLFDLYAAHFDDSNSNIVH